MCFQHALIHKIIKCRDDMQHCDDPERFPFESMRGMKPLKLPGYQRKLQFSIWGFQTHQTEKYSDV